MKTTILFITFILITVTTKAQDKSCFGKWRDVHNQHDFSDTREVFIDTTDAGREELNAHMDEYRKGLRKLDNEFVLNWKATRYEFINRKNEFILVINSKKNIEKIHLNYNAKTKEFLGNLDKKKVTVYYAKKPGRLVVNFFRTKEHKQTIELIKDKIYPN